MVHGSLGLYWRFIGVILPVHWGYIPVHWGYIPVHWGYIGGSLGLYSGSSGLYFVTKIVAYLSCSAKPLVARNSLGPIIHIRIGANLGIGCLFPRGSAGFTRMKFMYLTGNLP